MKFWVDAQLPPALATWLSQRPEVVSATAVRDLQLHVVDDRILWDAAKREGVIVVTKDSDFTALLARLGPPPQVLWVTVGNTSNTALTQAFDRSWGTISTLLSKGEPLVELTRFPAAP